MAEENGSYTPVDFIREAVKADLAAGRFDRVVTRFPPEPNGYLHIGHAKALWIDYGIAQDFGGTFNLRFDDTNPSKEEQEYVDAIVGDVRWVTGFAGEAKFASDYFGQMYDWAVELIRKGKAYVDDQSAEQISHARGTLTAPGRDSPFRNRSVEENVDLFARMRAGEFPDGSRVLRAKIDMASPNMNLRDPVMYRILHDEHHRTGKAWAIYPMYDWAHGLEDSIEGITFSLCSLEYENHRPLYDWFIDAINEGRTDDGSGPWGRKIHHPRQIEFARLNMTHTLMSKRKLLELVTQGVVRGWDDPRMPTLAGLRRRGVSPDAIRNFCRMIGIAKFNSVVDVGKLEFCIREDLNRMAPRKMAVLNPVKLVIDNYPVDQTEELDAINNPEDPAAGTRKVPFSRELFIEADDFRETPPPKFYRLFPGNEVRLRYAYFVKCVGVVKDSAGNVTEVHCTYDPASRGGDSPDGRKVKSTLHWVSAAHALPAEVRLYDHLFSAENPEEVPEGADWRANVNPNSLTVVNSARVEPSLAGSAAGERFQLERVGYFCVDADSTNGKLVFNRTVTLKDTWAKIEKGRKSE